MMQGNIIKYVADMLFPRLCVVCGRALNDGEKHVCLECMDELPLTGYHLVDFNPVEQLFAGKVPVEHATGYFFYERGSRHAAILHSIKYHNNPHLGEWLAGRFAAELEAVGWFGDVEAVVPVPLHRSKLAARGYNQSEYVARGLASVAGCRVERLVKAVKRHETQTHKGQYERQLNIAGVFRATQWAGDFAGKHILLVDDVVTTGATLLSCAEALKHAVPDIRISIATLAVARLQ